MDKSIRRHLARRGVFDTTIKNHEEPFAERHEDFFSWFEEAVMGFDSEEYRRRFWREAYRHGRTIGRKPYGFNEYSTMRGSIAIYFATMGVSFFFWIARREIDRHIHRLRRPTYYETERARRLALSEERRKLHKRRTFNAKPSMDGIRDALAHAHDSVEGMILLGSLMEDLECYVDNSPYFHEDGSFAGRRGGIRRLLQGEAPDLYARYKTLMRYKALSKRFRQAVGIGDPIPASAVLPSAAVAGGSTATCPSSEVGSATVMCAAKEVFRRSRELISDCECSMVSLAAQLALKVDPDYAPRSDPKGKTRSTNGRDGPNAGEYAVKAIA